MSGLKKSVSTEWRQFAILAFLSTGVFGSTVILHYLDNLVFRRFIGTIDPLLTILMTAIAGFLLFIFLVSDNRFSIYKNKDLRELAGLFGLVIGFALIAILVDLKVNFPEDINIPFPNSLLFYPAIAFFVEIVFHILPFSVLLFSISLIFEEVNRDKVIRICIFIVALFEPTYQMLFMESFPVWAITVIWLNLFFFNLTQLFIFRKYDFFSMYLFRLFYYAVWHIIWGYLRLDLVFS
jgi:hypothetical protein